MNIAAARKSSRPAMGQAALAAVVCTKPKLTAAMVYRGATKLAVSGTILCFVCVVPLAAGALIESYSVTQRGQQFNPGSLAIHQGDTVRIINDDGELIHHAYVDSQSFSFDSGDQEPGSKTDIRFSVPGQFVVLCGIHPKMRLDVVVK
jgi:plastocyanin